MILFQFLTTKKVMWINQPIIGLTAWQSDLRGFVYSMFYSMFLFFNGYWFICITGAQKKVVFFHKKVDFFIAALRTLCFFVMSQSVRYLPWKYLNFKGSKKKYTVAGFLQGHPYWTPKKGSKGRWAKFWNAWIWHNFLCQKMLFLAIFTHVICTK